LWYIELNLDYYDIAHLFNLNENNNNTAMVYTPVYANEMTERDSDIKWNDVYRVAGLQRQEEKEAFKDALLKYWMINGTSPEMNYLYVVVTYGVDDEGNPVSVKMAEPSKQFTADTRKFARTSQDRAYALLQEQTMDGQVLRDAVYGKNKDKIESSRYAACLVDFFDRCLTPDEARIAVKLKNRAIVASNFSKRMVRHDEAKLEHRQLGTELLVNNGVNNYEY